MAYISFNTSGNRYYRWIIVFVFSWFAQSPNFGPKQSWPWCSRFIFKYLFDFNFNFDLEYNLKTKIALKKLRKISNVSNHVNEILSERESGSRFIALPPSVRTYTKQLKNSWLISFSLHVTVQFSGIYPVSVK